MTNFFTHHGLPLLFLVVMIAVVRDPAAGRDSADRLRRARRRGALLDLVSDWGRRRPAQSSATISAIG